MNKGLSEEANIGDSHSEIFIDNIDLEEIDESYSTERDAILRWWAFVIINIMLLPQVYNYTKTEELLPY